VRFTPATPAAPGSRRGLDRVVERLDPGDQVVHPLARVLAALVQLVQALLALGELAAEPRVLGAQRVEALDQRLDGPREPALVVLRLRRRSRARGRLRALENRPPPGSRMAEGRLSAARRRSQAETPRKPRRQT
jgi:hypothetical protein